MTTSIAILSVPISGSGRLLVYWSRIICLLAALAALALLGACSAVKLAYNNAPDLVYWWIDGYADLGEAQSLQVREDLERLHQWHRGTELPRIAELLRRMQLLAGANTSPAQVCALFAEARSRFDAVVNQAGPGVVALATSLSAAQLAHIETRSAKANAEWRKDWASGNPQERHDKRMKAAVERSEQFYGTLEERQLAVLRTAIAQSGFDPELSYAERLRRQQDLQQTLRFVNGTSGSAKPDTAQATTALRAYLERSINSPNPAYRAYTDKAVLDNCNTFAQLHNSTTAEQRTRAVRRLGAYERDARELAAPR